MALMPAPLPKFPPGSGLRDLLDLFTNDELAGALGVPYSTAASIRRRNSVAAKHWGALVTATKAKGYYVTWGDLLAWAKQRKPYRPTRWQKIKDGFSDIGVAICRLFR